MKNYEMVLIDLKQLYPYEGEWGRIYAQAAYAFDDIETHNRKKIISIKEWSDRTCRRLNYHDFNEVMLRNGLASLQVENPRHLIGQYLRNVLNNEEVLQAIAVEDNEKVGRFNVSASGIARENDIARITKAMDTAKTRNVTRIFQELLSIRKWELGEAEINPYEIWSDVMNLLRYELKVEEGRRIGIAHSAMIHTFYYYSEE